MSAEPARRASAPDIAVNIESPLWDAQPEAGRMVHDAIMAAAARVPSEGELSVLLADDGAVQALNRDWRNIDKPTNVLSFPSDAPRLAGVPALLGDIAIAFETLDREAAAEKKPFLHHLAHLAVHGYLHLLGYDHQTDSEAEAMEALEREILAAMRIPDPYSADAADIA
jgi:probable rRNA maturation factor